MKKTHLLLLLVLLTLSACGSPVENQQMVVEPTVAPEPATEIITEPTMEPTEVPIVEAVEPTPEEQSVNSVRLSNESETVEIQLVAGILKLEGRADALSAEQATNILPAILTFQMINANPDVQEADYASVNEEIQSYMSAEQVTNIHEMQITVFDLIEVMEQAGLQVPSGPPGGGGGPPSGGGNGRPAGGFGGADAHTQIPVDLVDYLVQFVTARANS